MNRKNFIKKSVGAMLLAVPTYSFVGCSSDDTAAAEPEPNPSGSGVDCVINGTGIAIGTNHGHTLTVSKEDVNAGTEKTYSIQGSSGHDHTIVLSAANFTSLQNKTGISVTSTNDAGHTHTVAVSCA